MRKIKLPTSTFEYDPDRPLGKPGGFGAVFLGRTPSGDEVAIKKLHVKSATASHREFRVVEELRGRSLDYIIPFIDAGEDADTGEYFVVMARAERSLQAHVDRNGPLLPVDAASAMFQIVKGLVEAGELVHRDLKPDNILFHSDRWKLADFGIAKFVEDATSSHTFKGCGSEDYAAPEQWLSEKVSKETDIYALGCIGVYLLTGRPPFLDNHRQNHLQGSLPDFKCDDARLRVLINMMVRKHPETRPTLRRVEQQLAELVDNPLSLQQNNSMSDLIAVAAGLAEQQQREEAKRKAAEAAENARRQLSSTGVQILSENCERLLAKLNSQVPILECGKSPQLGILYCKMGKAILQVQPTDNGGNRALEFPLYFDAFPRSKWDVVTGARVVVRQEAPAYEWSASLWYMRTNQRSNYRWHEVSYTYLGGGGRPAVSAAGVGDADLAASGKAPPVAHAFGPIPIDDEEEYAFHERWIWLFAKAAGGKLTRPAQLPFSWPPF